MEAIQVLTYNIHKGFSSGNVRYALKNIRESIRDVKADLVFLQEVIGHHEHHFGHMNDWPTSSQFEYLADQTWNHYAYGKNAIYSEGHHGNAILSKYPIEFHENEDISFSKYERRGMLHAEIHANGSILHAFCIHLGLFEKDRKKQVQKLCDRISRMVPSNCSMIIAGDFNDWNRSAGEILQKELGTKEAFQEHFGKHAGTFPSWLPVLPLDRIYYRNLQCTSVKLLQGDLWKKQSDHLPLLAKFEFPEEKTP